jgi:hypothetical protein
MNSTTLESGGFLASQTLWRRSLMFLAVAFFAAVFALPRGGTAAWSLVFIITTTLPLASAVLASLTRKQFGEGEPGRRLWSLIALICISDSIVCACFVIPRVVNFGAAATLIIATTFLVSVSRIVLAWALWIMVRLYRKSGLDVGLTGLDYALIVAVMAASLTSVLFAGTIARSVLNVTRPDLIRWVSIAGLPHLAALAACSVLGIMVWRYAQQMGGGLIAKAWRSILLYAVIWLARLGVLGGLGSLFGMDTYNRPVWASMFDFASILAAEYLLFLGISYQYEACTGAVTVDESELESITP